MRDTVLFIAAILVFAGCQGAPVRTTDSGVPKGPSEIKEVSPSEAGPEVAKAYSQFIDVRTPEEYSSGHAARSVNIPMDTLPAKLDRLERDEPVYLICQSGGRSGTAAQMLKAAGFNNVLSVRGGTTAWEAADFPMETKSPHEGPAAK
jgi:rhodanese-related sulfurtransferase